VLSFSHPQLTEGLAILLEVRRREVKNFVLLQKLVDLHARLETQKPAKLPGRKCPRPVSFESQAFERGSRQVLPPEFKSLCDIFRQFQSDPRGNALQFII
jgi:hypothetical protein